VLNFINGTIKVTPKKRTMKPDIKAKRRCDFKMRLDWVNKKDGQLIKK
jgi:hypothetical protein